MASHEEILEIDLSRAISWPMSLRSSGLVRHTPSTTESRVALSSQAALLKMKKMAGSICCSCMAATMSGVLGTRCQRGLLKGKCGSPAFSSLQRGRSPVTVNPPSTRSSCIRSSCWKWRRQYQYLLLMHCPADIERQQLQSCQSTHVAALAPHLTDE